MHVNGNNVDIAAAGTVPLLYPLRNELGLKGVRPGCAIGECGACTVLVDGVATRSCLTPVEAVGDQPIITPEGLGTPDRPHPVQQAFIDEQAAQCGYCINGIIMTVAAIADGPVEGRAEALDAALTEHICRCGTHVRILRAARRALLGEADNAAGSDGTAVVRTVCSPACESTPAPSVLQDSPVVENWLRVLPDGRIEAFTGKVEIGQGIGTAMAQLVAAQLEVGPRDVVVRSAAAPFAPDERYTAGSLSVEQGGMALASAATALRRLLVARAAERLGVGPDVLEVSGGVVGVDDRRLTFAELVEDAPITGPIEGADRPHWHGGTMGISVPRSDLPAKVTGSAAFIHDIELDGMLHARAVLPPTYGARLESVDLDAKTLPGVSAVVRDGSLLLVVAEREDQARAAAERLQHAARWNDPGLEVGRDILDTFRNLDSTPITAHADDGVEAALDAATQRVAASYSRPYQAHGAMSPSCAVAVAHGQTTTVYSHTQGVYPLRRELAAILGTDESSVVVQHADGPGCYGHNCADDAAAFAALAAQAVAPAPVRFQMSSEDELTWDPFGSAMLTELEAGLDVGGRIAAWRHRSRTDVHSTRPTGSGDRLIPSWLRGEGRPRPWPGPHETGIRNSIPLYDFPAVESVTDYVRGPLRTSALRALASHQNIFAIESFVDELAEVAGQDPVAFRLAHLSDERARDVLETAASTAGWQPHVGPSGRGQGIAVCRYKNTKAYVAVVVDATMDPERGTIAVSRVVVACDAGVVVNPDGLANQLEGGVIQGLSRALFEEVRADDGGVRSRDWTSYPVLRFADVPAVDVVIIDRHGAAPVGVGEASTPPVAPALANALDDAIGIRLRSLPLTGEQARRRLGEMTDDEMARVLLG